MNQAPSLSSCIFYSFIRRLCRFCFISPLHMPHSPPGVFSIPNCAFGLSPIPSSPVCAPCSAQICCLCSLRCAHMLALPLPSPPPPAPGPSSVPFASCQPLCQGAHQRRKDFAMAAAPVSCCRLLSTAQGEPMLLP